MKYRQFRSCAIIHVVAMVVAHHTSVHHFFIVIVFSVYYYSDERGGWLAMHPIHPPVSAPGVGWWGAGGVQLAIFCVSKLAMEQSR